MRAQNAHVFDSPFKADIPHTSDYPLAQIRLVSPSPFTLFKRVYNVTQPQGDPPGCYQDVVDMKTKIVLQCEEHILKH